MKIHSKTGQLTKSMIFIFSLVFFIHAQPEDVSYELRAAQKFEEVNEWSRAYDIYLSLVNRFPNNDVFFRHYIELCSKEKRFDQAFELLEKRRGQKSNDPALEVFAAQLAFRAGMGNEAKRIWTNIIETYPKEEWIADLVASTMSQERLLDQAIQVYLKARKRIGKPDLFSLNLASLYEMNIEYGKAVFELIGFLRINPSHLYVVESRLLRYPASEKTIREVSQVLKKCVQDEPKKYDFLKLLAGYETHFGLYEDGLETIMNMEKMVPEKQSGEALFDFASKAYASGGIELSRKAYQQILQKLPRFKRMDGVYYGLSLCEKNLGMYKEAVSRLDELIVKCPQSGLMASALLEKGLLERDNLYQPAQSSQTFGRLISDFSSSPESAEALLELADCYFLINDLSKTETVYAQVLRMDSPSSRKLKIRAMIRMAWLDYFLGRFEKSQALLDSLFRRPLDAGEIQDPSVNDGLVLSLMLKAYAKEDSASLRLLSRGVLSYKQRRYLEALIFFDQAASTPKTGNTLVAEALYQKGIVLLAMNRYREGVDCFGSLVKGFPDYVYSERAYERMGWAEEKSGKSNDALKTYESLLSRFPHSMYAEEVRKRIKKIEMDTAN